MKKVNASNVTIEEIKDLIEKEYQNNFVIFTNNNKNEIDEQFQLVQSIIINISPSNQEVIKTIFESLQNKVMKFSNNDLQIENKTIQSDFKIIKNIFQHSANEIKNQIGNDIDVLFTFNSFRKKIKSLMLKINENNTKNIDIFKKLYFEKIQQNKE